MANHDTWKVLPHGPIEKLGSHLWYVLGSLESGPLKRVMVVAKRQSGGLVVHNGVCLEEERMAEIEAWGKPEVLIVPNGYHRLDAKAFKTRYPDLKVLCPRKARARAAEVVAVDGTYEDFDGDEHVKLETLDGTDHAEGVMLVTGDDGVSLVLNDVVFNMPHVPGFTGFVMKSLLSSSGGPRVSRLSRMFLVKDRKALRAHLERLADTRGLVRVIVSHHEVISEHPKETLREVAATV